MRPTRLSHRREPFDSDQFIFELKIDGFRALAHIEAGALFSCGDADCAPEAVAGVALSIGFSAGIGAGIGAHPHHTAAFGRPQRVRLSLSF